MLNVRHKHKECWMEAQLIFLIKQFTKPNLEVFQLCWDKAYPLILIQSGGYQIFTCQLFFLYRQVVVPKKQLFKKVIFIISDPPPAQKVIKHFARTHTMLAATHTVLTTKHTVLTTKHTSLTKKHTSLTKKHTSLTKKHTMLATKHTV